MNCQYCNNPIPQGSATCPSCGAPAPMQTQPQMQMPQQPQQPPQQPFGQAPYGQAPYGQAPYAQGGYPGAYTNIKSNMTEAILVTIFCCQIFGIIAIVYASQVSGHLACGRVMEAQKAANSAKNWCTAGFICGLVFSLLYVFIAFAGAL